MLELARPYQAAKQRPVQVKEPSRKMNPKDQEYNLPRLTAREEEQLQRQLPGVDRFIAFFRAAGVPMGIGRDGHLWINRPQTRPLAWVRPSPKTPDWNKIIDEVTLLITSDKFIRAVRENARFGKSFRGVLRGTEYVIMRGDVQMGVIHPTHAKIPRREVICANFLTPGPHWQQVADVLHDAELELVAKWKHEQETKAAATAARGRSESEDAKQRLSEEAQPAAAHRPTAWPPRPAQERRRTAAHRPAARRPRP